MFYIITSIRSLPARGAPLSQTRVRRTLTKCTSPFATHAPVLEEERRPYLADAGLYKVHRNPGLRARWPRTKDL